MPELPEVEALAGFLRERAVGRTIARIDAVAINALKTFDPPVTDLVGRRVAAVSRHGKFLDLATRAEGPAGEGPAEGSGEDSGEIHLVVHLARAGWLRWSAELPTTPPKQSRKSRIALRVHLGGGEGFDLTEAGTQKKLAAYVVTDPAAVPGVARLGPDPLSDELTRARFTALLVAAGRGQLKGVLTDQGRLAGIGNAYSDEILHAARLSPFKPAAGMSDGERDRLYGAMRGVLRDAADRSRGLGAGELKDDKKTNLAVHGRTGLACPVCGDTVREVSFADSSLQYCPTCQTGGKPLADRRMSRLLK